MRLFPRTDSAVYSLNSKLSIERRFDTSRVLNKSVAYQSNIASFGDGVILASPSGLNNVVESYSLTWNNRPVETIREIEAFFKMVGTHETFIWIEPDEDTRILVKLTGDVSVSKQLEIGTITATFLRVYQ